MQFWDSYHKIYYKFLISSPAYKKLITEVISLLKENLKKGDSILDSGCGSGFLSNELVKEKFNVISLDNSSKALSILRQKYPALPAYQIDLKKKLPYDDNLFDAIVSINTLYVFSQSEIPAILNEYRRILKTNGIIILSDPQKHFKNKKIFTYDIKKIIENFGLIGALIHIIKNMINYLRLLYFNIIIDHRAHMRVYSFFSNNQYINNITEAGFKIMNLKKIYADQNIIIIAKNNKS